MRNIDIGTKNCGFAIHLPKNVKKLAFNKQLYSFIYIGLLANAFKIKYHNSEILDKLLGIER